jgi:hypothetical protein
MRPLVLSDTAVILFLFSSLHFSLRQTGGGGAAKEMVGGTQKSPAEHWHILLGLQLLRFIHVASNTTPINLPTFLPPFG